MNVSRSLSTTVARLLVAAVALGGLTAGCATPAQVRQADTPAERLFQSAEARFERGDYEGAIERYDRVRNDFPYSQYAVRSDLRIADAYFAQDQYASASEQYRTFVKLHPKHEKVDYARFRIGKALHAQMPKNWFFMPPAHERDLSSTRKAARQLEQFVDSYPKSEYVDDANELLREARRRLADHEMYVANFHFERDNPKGASMRLKYLLNNYSGLGLDPRALWMLAQSYEELGEGQKAKTALEDLVEYHPDSKYTDRARDYLKERDWSKSAEKESQSG